jgi:excisionase family DNA binding protein
MVAEQPVIENHTGRYLPFSVICIEPSSQMKGSRAMAQKTKFLSTSEFSKLTGIPVSTIGKLIREGKIKGKKASGKWKIAESQLKAKAVKELSQVRKQKPTLTKEGDIIKKAAKTPSPSQEKKKTAAAAQKPAGPPKDSKRSANDYSVAEFSQITYLTDFGVEDFLKKGRLKGVRDQAGNWRVFAENLNNPSIRHLIR